MVVLRQEPAARVAALAYFASPLRMISARSASLDAHRDVTPLQFLVPKVAELRMKCKHPRVMR